MIKIYLFLDLFLCTHQGLAATFVVYNNANNDDLLPYSVADGSNTLRKYIRLANTMAELDQIQFNLVGSTIKSNTLPGTAALFRISDPIEMDAYSQPEASAVNPMAKIRGISLGCWFAFKMLNGASTSQLKGMIINENNVETHISPNTQSMQIASGYIGTNSLGLSAAVHPITEDSIRIERLSNSIIGGSAGLIDRNVIGGCMQEGIRIQAPAFMNNRVRGNFIGTTTVAGGTGSLVHNLGLSPNEAAAVTATQTTNTVSNSEFSNCTPSILLSSQSIQFHGQPRPKSNWLYWWINTFGYWTIYSLQKSIDGIDGYSIQQINLNMNSPHQKKLSFQNKGLGQEPRFYYRLQLNDQSEGYRYIYPV